MGPRPPGGLLLGLLLLSLAGCAIDAEQAVFLEDPTGLSAELRASCTEGAPSGSLWLTLSDFTGATYVAEPAGDRVWVRNAFGLVPDHCYWISTEPDHPEWPEEGRPACFVDGLNQDGSCSGDEEVPDGGGWKFVHGGFIGVPNLRSRLAVDGTLAVAWAGQQPATLRVVDLVPDDDGCPEDQRPWSMHTVLSALDVPSGYSGFLDGDLAVNQAAGLLVGLSPTDEELAVWTLPLPCEDGEALPAPVRVPLPAAPDGPLALDASGGRAFALSSEGPSVIIVEGLGEDEPTARRRILSGMQGASDVAYEPVTDTVWVAAPAAGEGKVKSFPADGGEAVVWTAPGASRLAVGRTDAGGDQTPRVYAAAEGASAVHRFDPVAETAVVQELAGTIRGFAIGGQQQEIAVAIEEAGGAVVLRSMVDRDHLDAQAAGSVQLLAAAFLEYPRDAQLDRPDALTKEIETFPSQCEELASATNGWPQLDRDMYQACCLHAARGAQVDANLAYLERAVLDGLPGEERVEVLLGVNPTVLLQSSHCIHAGLELGHEELIDFAAPLLMTLDTWGETIAERGDVRRTLLVHTPAGSSEQVPYTCPDLWRPDLVDPDCDVDVEAPAAFEAFLGDLLDTAALRRVAEPYQGTGGCGPDELPLSDGCQDLEDWGWTLEGIAGGFDRAMGLYAEYPSISWPSSYAAVYPGPAAPFTYFGGGGNYDRTSHAVAKELAPWDARQRRVAFRVGDDPVAWDAPDPAGPIDYLPGVTIAQTRLFENARSGLFVSDMFWHGLAEGDHWQTDDWPQTESPETMGPADFGVLTHYLVYRVLAARDAELPRVFYLHLPDIGTIGLPAYEDGRVACTDEADCANRDALQDWLGTTLPALGPALAWGLPEGL